MKEGIAINRPDHPDNRGKLDRKTWHERLDEVEASFARLADFDAEVRRAVASDDLHGLDLAYSRWATERRICMALFREMFDALEAAGEWHFPSEPPRPMPPHPELPPEPMRLLWQAQADMNAGLAGAQGLISVALVFVGLAALLFVASLVK